MCNLSTFIATQCRVCRGVISKGQPFATLLTSCTIHDTLERAVRRYVFSCLPGEGKRAACRVGMTQTRPGTPTSTRNGFTTSIVGPPSTVVATAAGSASASSDLHHNKLPPSQRGSYSALPFTGTRPITPSVEGGEFVFSTQLRRQSAEHHHHHGHGLPLPFHLPLPLDDSDDDNVGGLANGTAINGDASGGAAAAGGASSGYAFGGFAEHRPGHARVRSSSLHSKGIHHHHPFAHTAGVVTPSARFARCTVEETAAQLQTSLATGLTSSVVPAIREISGPNEFQVASQEKALSKFAKQFYESPLILLLLGSAGVSALVGNLDDAVSITVAIVIVVTGERAAP